MEVFKFAGLSIGIAVGLILCLFIFKFANKDNKLKTEYDERQKALKGRGYMFGFYTMAVFEAVIVALASCGFEFGIPEYALSVFGIFLGITVVCVHGIWTGAYWGINNDIGRYTAVFVVLFIINVLPVVMVVTKLGFNEDFPYVNLFCTLMLAAIAVTSWIRNIVDKAEEE